MSSGFLLVLCDYLKFLISMDFGSLEFFLKQRITNSNYFRIRKPLVSIISESKNHWFRLFLKYQGISIFHERTNKVLMVIKTFFWNWEYIKTELLIRLYAKMVLDWNWKLWTLWCKGCYVWRMWHHMENQNIISTN